MDNQPQPNSTSPNKAWFVLGKHPSADEALIGHMEDQILADRDHGCPLIFPSEDAAWAYFASQSGGRSPESLRAFTRQAHDDEVQHGIAPQ